MKMIVFILIFTMTSNSLAETAMRKASFTRGEVCAGIFINLLKTEMKRSELQNLKDSEEAVGIAKTFRTTFLPSKDPSVFGKDEVLITDTTTDPIELEKAAVRLKGLESIYSGRVIPLNNAFEFTTDGFVIRGGEAIENFIKAFSKEALVAEGGREKFLHSVEARGYDLAIKGLISSALISFSLHHPEFFNNIFGHYGTMTAFSTLFLSGLSFIFTAPHSMLSTPIMTSRVSREETFHQVYLGIIENIRYAQKSGDYAKWIYWGMNAQLPLDFAYSTISQEPQENSAAELARLTFPLTSGVKKTVLANSTPVQFDVLFKFEVTAERTIAPVLVVVMRNVALKDGPPRTPRKPKENKDPELSWDWGLKPVPIPIR